MSAFDKDDCTGFYPAEMDEDFLKKVIDKRTTSRYLPLRATKGDKR